MIRTCVLLVAAVALAGCKGSPEMDALLKCQKIIKVASKNPSSAEVPYVKGRAITGGFTFDWRHGDGLQLKNGFGAMLDTTASCTVKNNRVDSLTVSGQRYN